MTTRIILTVALAVALAAGAAACAARPWPTQPPLAGDPRPFALPRETREKLDNGLEIVSAQHGRLPLVAMRLVVMAGSAVDPADKSGLAELTARLLREGAGDRDGNAIAEAIERVGGDLDVDTTADWSVVSCDALREHAGVCLDLLFDLAARPTFPQAEVDRLRRERADELRLEETRPGFVGRREVHRAVFGMHPYAQMAPTATSVAGLTRDDVTTFHRTHFMPGNARLILVGDVEGAGTLAAAKERFAAWKWGRTTPARLAQPPENGPWSYIHFIDRAGSVQTTLLAGNLALARAHPDFIPLRVTNHILGGGASSRLFMELRERKSYTYGAYSQVSSHVHRGLFLASTDVRNEVAADALRDLLALVEDVRAGRATAQELTDAQSYLTGVFPIELQSVAAVADTLSAREAFGLPQDLLATYRDAVRAVTLAQVQAMAAAHFRPTCVIAVGSADAVADALAVIRDVRVYDGTGKLLRTIPRRDPATP